MINNYNYSKEADWQLLSVNPGHRHSSCFFFFFLPLPFLKYNSKEFSFKRGPEGVERG